MAGRLPRNSRSLLTLAQTDRPAKKPGLSIRSVASSSGSSDTSLFIRVPDGRDPFLLLSKVSIWKKMSFGPLCRLWAAYLTKMAFQKPPVTLPSRIPPFCSVQVEPLPHLIPFAGAPLLRIRGFLLSVFFLVLSSSFFRLLRATEGNLFIWGGRAC